MNKDPKILKIMLKLSKFKDIFSIFSDKSEKNMSENVGCFPNITKKLTKFGKTNSF